ncbi:DNA polymerase III subunit delta' [Levilactobacillus suantsaii]|uniref:DNA polymerase III subunit delta n=1 Tax=Levilactobacillus suantsaii TaxID=2292255 RepID=A0A4Q0VKD2_9LACO|nr:DNA polymerase III subunit delta' [Levilactobacillus suantsaii]QMU07104.1 DNA polymerase III subunit delta' [Levilactobacillus suantsaii]RXI80123.1 DNA polymerase III subunit delta' [Levilactobacillus suantsaii]
MTEESPITTVQRLQPQLLTHFMHLIQAGDLSHAYLFNGMDGTGRQALAETVALRLFCQNVTADGLPCGQCAECRRILAGDHPDVIRVVPDGQRIKVDQVRYLKAEFTKSAVEGNQKIFIVDQIERMTTGAANSLLKFIEEPVGNTVALLLTTNKNLILPTILSRTQIVDLLPVAPKELASALADVGVAPSQQTLLTTLTESIAAAKDLVADDWLATAQKRVEHWFSACCQADERAFVRVQTELVPLATNRDRQGIVLDMLVEVWHDALLQQAGPVAKETLSYPQVATQSQQIAQQLSVDRLVAVVTLTLNTRQQLAGNLNFQAILETLTLQILAQVAR